MFANLKDELTHTLQIIKMPQTSKDQNAFTKCLLPSVKEEKQNQSKKWGLGVSKWKKMWPHKPQPHKPQQNEKKWDPINHNKMKENMTPQTTTYLIRRSTDHFPVHIKNRACSLRQSKQKWHIILKSNFKKSRIIFHQTISLSIIRYLDTKDMRSWTKKKKIQKNPPKPKSGFTLF